MIIGVVHSASPHVTLTLSGHDGPLEVKFVVDTGFEGDLALPRSLADEIIAEPLERRLIVLADGTPTICLRCLTEINWNDDLRLTEVLVLEGAPLLGMLLLEGNYLHIEATEGGEVVIESL